MVDAIVSKRRKLGRYWKPRLWYYESNICLSSFIIFIEYKEYKDKFRKQDIYKIQESKINIQMY